MDLTHSIDGHIPFPAEVVTLQSSYFVIHEIQFIQRSLGSDTRSTYGLLAQEILNGSLGTPVWVTGSGGMGYNFASPSLKSVILTELTKPGSLNRGSPNGVSPKGQIGLIESFTAKLPYGWIKVGRGTNDSALGPFSQDLSANFIYVQRSSNGIDFGKPEVTNIPNSPSGVASIVTSTGKRLIFWNPTANRIDLVYAISNDGLNYPVAYIVRNGLGSTPVYTGIFKGGGPAYPSAVQLSNSDILVAYSVYKEQIWTTRFTLP